MTLLATEEDPMSTSICILQKISTRVWFTRKHENDSRVTGRLKLNSTTN